MKYSIVFFATIFLAIVSLAYADYEDEYRAEYCSPSILPADAKGSCVEYTCNKEQTEMNAKTCSESRCPPGTQIGYKEEKDKPYPECCPHPICSDVKKPE